MLVFFKGFQRPTKGSSVATCFLGFRDKDLRFRD